MSRSATQSNGRSSSELPTLEQDRGLDADTLELHRALSDLIRVYQFRDRDRICCYDVSVTQCYALEAVILRGPLTLNELAAQLYLDKSTTSRVVDGLQKKGYMERRESPEDRRALQLEPTAEGRELYVRIERDILAEEKALLASFPPEVRRAMASLIGQLARAAAAGVDASGGSCCRIA